MSGVDPNGGGALVIPSGGASLSDATPAALGTAAAGVATSASRADHVHEAPAGGTAHTSGTLAARPASPAAGDTYRATDWDVDLVCFVAGTWRVAGAGPVAVTRGPFAGTYYDPAGSIASSAVGTAVGPTGGPGWSFALGMHLDALPAAVQQVVWEFYGTAGWILTLSPSGGTNNVFGLHQKGINSDAYAEMATVTTGAGALAFSVAPAEIRWVWKDGAVGSRAISGTYTPPSAAARHVLGNHLSSASLMFSSGSLAWAAAYNSILSDAALQAAVADHAAYLPGDAGVAPTFGWMAAKSSRDVGYHRTIGSPGALQLYTPGELGWTAR